MNSAPETKPWQPGYTITSAMLNSLLAIGRARTVVERLPLSPAADAELRRQARLRATHYSTKIEGNRLSLAEVEQVLFADKDQGRLDFLSGNGQVAIEPEAGTVEPEAQFRGRERDVAEVRNYWEALLRVEDWAAAGKRLTEQTILKLHAIVEQGPKAGPSAYRDGQNAVREAGTGVIVYLPPEARDVPALMASLLAWAELAEADLLAPPLLAGILHYQFVTIHPFFDGNGRTARLLATFILHRAGYDLKGFYSLEEHYAKDLGGYYSSLETHPHHNYYEGRAEADLTVYLEYFLASMAKTFLAVERATEEASARGVPTLPTEFRRLDPRARRVLGLFASSERITSKEVAEVLGLSTRMVRNLLTRWAAEGWLEVADPARRTRSYNLTATYRQYFNELITATEA